MEVRKEKNKKQNKQEVKPSTDRRCRSKKPLVSQSPSLYCSSSRVPILILILILLIKHVPATKQEKWAQSTQLCPPQEQKRAELEEEKKKTQEVEKEASKSALSHPQKTKKTKIKKPEYKPNPFQ
jgi:predicted GTPase